MNTIPPCAAQPLVYCCGGARFPLTRGVEPFTDGYITWMIRSKTMNIKLLGQPPRTGMLSTPLPPSATTGVMMTSLHVLHVLRCI